VAGRGTHDDAVVALRRLDVELVLQQEPGGSYRVAEAAEHLREKGAWSATELRIIRLTDKADGSMSVAQASPRLQGILPGTGSRRTCRCTACTRRSTRTWKCTGKGTQASMKGVNTALPRRDRRETHSLLAEDHGN
jgi:hypothetical protein